MSSQQGTRMSLDPLIDERPVTTQGKRHDNYQEERVHMCVPRDSQDRHTKPVEEG